DGVDTGVAAQGPAGAEPVITVGSDGTWYVDGVSTGVTAQGAVGPQGPAGPEPVITVGSDGTWYVDGVSTGVTAQGAVGPQGPAGDTGPAGPAGTNGTNGVNGTGAILTFDSGSYTIPGVPPVLTLNTVVGNLANTSVYIGASMWGPQVSALGAAISLDSTGIPPWPMKVTKGGSITEWAASFESIAAAGINLAVLDPLGILGLTNPTVNASLLHAPALTSSPEALGDLNFTVIDTINLGEIPLVGVFSAYTGDHTLATPVTINAGDYLMVQFYINSSSALTVAVSVDGFHAQASVAIS
ncbi:MAG: collagen-like protein, partial [Defluviitaleaceae bacterium]|nr:collagen-like protein [Defluviitaleaceae bacterium]